MRPDGFGLLVEDMAGMIRFYRDVLDFEIREKDLNINGKGAIKDERV